MLICKYFASGILRVLHRVWIFLRVIFCHVLFLFLLPLIIKSKVDAFLVGVFSASYKDLWICSCFLRTWAVNCTIVWKIVLRSGVKTAEKAVWEMVICVNTSIWHDYRYLLLSRKYLPKTKLLNFLCNIQTTTHNSLSILFIWAWQIHCFFLSSHFSCNPSGRMFFSYNFNSSIYI